MALRKAKYVHTGGVNARRGYENVASFRRVPGKHVAAVEEAVKRDGHTGNVNHLFGKKTYYRVQDPRISHGDVVSSLPETRPREALNSYISRMRGTGRKALREGNVEEVTRINRGIERAIGTARKQPHIYGNVGLMKTVEGARSATGLAVTKGIEKKNTREREAWIKAAPKREAAAQQRRSNAKKKRMKAKEKMRKKEARKARHVHA